MYQFARAALMASACVLTAGNMPAQGDALRQLRFSPDGRYVVRGRNQQPMRCEKRGPTELVPDQDGQSHHASLAHLIR
jgi:hypothetical protein